MKKAKNVNEFAEEIKSGLDSIMGQTYYKCKSSDPEIAAEARQINSDARSCLVLLERLVSECKRRKTL